MSRYNFQSTGAAAGNAIEQFLVQRALQERQRKLDEFAAQNTRADNARADEQLELTRENSRQATADRQSAQAAREADARFRKASTIATVGLPGVIDQSTSELLNGEGFGTLVGEQAPGVLEFKGGSQYQQARTAASERGAQATQAQQAAAERAAADRQMRETIAGAANQGKAETQGLRNDLLRQQVEAAKQKQDEAKHADEAKAAAVAQYEGDISGVLNQLLDEQGNLRPEAARVVGGISARLPNLTETAQQGLSQIDRLVGLLDINKLREMKAQSKTGASGFGALSERELSVLENAASTLKNRKVGEGDYAAELRRIRDTLHKPHTATGAGRVYYDANGQPVQR